MPVATWALELIVITVGARAVVVILVVKVAPPAGITVWAKVKPPVSVNVTVYRPPVEKGSPEGVVGLPASETYQLTYPSVAPLTDTS